MQTQYYNNMLNRFAKLKRSFLPKVFSPIGKYKDSTYEKTRAYKVLTHAEIEYYFEQTVLAIATTAFRRWNTSNKPSKTLVALVAYYAGVFPPLQELKGGNNSEHNLDERVNKSFQCFCAYVNCRNHGIKEADILGLSLPIGFNEADISDDLLLALNNYGSIRGLIAHSTRAKQNLSPDDVRNEANTVIGLIGSLDIMFQDSLSKLEAM